MQQKRTFKEVADEWLLIQSVKQKASTLLKYTNIVNNHLLPYFNNVDVREINEKQFVDFVNEKIMVGNLKNNTSLSPSYIKTIIIIFNSIMEYATDMNYCEILKLNCVLCPSIPKRPINVLDIESQAKLIKYISRNISHTGVAIALALYAGLRIGEICALRWDDINMKKMYININHTVARVLCNQEDAVTKLILDTPKTSNSIRVVPINSKLLQMLKMMYLQSTSAYVASSTNTFIRINKSVARLWKKSIFKN